MFQRERFYYLVKFQYLGFRFHGWQVQPDVKTVQLMLQKTLAFVFKHRDFKILGASRTDAMVSAIEAAFELFVYEELDTADLTVKLNKSLPADIRVTQITQVNAAFNIIKCPKIKEYHYYFSFGEKLHPFTAPFMLGVKQELDISLMQQGAKLFEGTHNFRRYAYKPSDEATLEREILACTIVENTELKANFFPEKSFVFKIKSTGFLRYQVRLMVGALLQLGSGEIDLLFIENTLKNPIPETLKELAPASGLHLYKIDFF